MLCRGCEPEAVTPRPVRATRRRPAPGAECPGAHHGKRDLTHAAVASGAHSRTPPKPSNSAPGDGSCGLRRANAGGGARTFGTAHPPHPRLRPSAPAAPLAAPGTAALCQPRAQSGRSAGAGSDVPVGGGEFDTPARLQISIRFRYLTAGQLQWRLRRVFGVEGGRGGRRAGWGAGAGGVEVFRGAFRGRAAPHGRCGRFALPGRRSVPSSHTGGSAKAGAKRHQALRTRHSAGNGRYRRRVTSTGTA